MLIFFPPGKIYVGNYPCANETFSDTSIHYKPNHDPNWQAELPKSF